MPITKTNLLSRLNKYQLREIALAEGIRLPKKARKSAIIQRLLRLSMSKIKEYVAEYEEEEITRRTIIEEKIRRRRIRAATREEEKVEVELRDAKIVSLLDAKIDRKIIEIIANKYRSKIEGRSIPKILKSLNDGALDALYRTFVKHEKDRKGLFLEFRAANFIRRKYKDLADKIVIRKRHLGDIPREFDVVCYDKKGRLRILCECKSKNNPVSVKDMNDFIANVKAILKNGKYASHFEYAFFFTTSDYTQEALSIYRKNVDKKGRMSTWIASLSTLIDRVFVDIYLFIERDGQFIRVKP